MSMKKVITRGAPSPTGMAHIGNIRTFLYNYLFAKKHNGEFYLRIEDTDRDRYVPEAEAYLKDALDWFGITPDHSPWNPKSDVGSYYQSERDYSKYVSILLDKGVAYYAFDTTSDIDAKRKENPHFTYDASTRMSMKNSLTLSSSDVQKLLNDNVPYTIRYKVQPNMDISFNDLSLGVVTINSNQIDDKVLIKSNGLPSYHLANVCDDHDFGTTHVIRGAEWVSSTPFHVILYNTFGWDLPIFCHLSSILAPDGKGKLSKRHSLKYDMPVFPFSGTAEDDKGKIVNYKGFREAGLIPQACVNFMALIGWTPDDNSEIMSMDNLIDKFDLSRVHKAGGRFDYDKLKWFNSEYLNEVDNKDLLQHMDIDPSMYDTDKLNMLIDICKNRSVTFNDLNNVLSIFTKNDFDIDLKKINNESFQNVFTSFIQNIDVNFDWTIDNIKSKISNISNDKNIKIGKVMPSLRMALVGGMSGPDLMTTMYILGKDETKNRISKCLDICNISV